jgi:hypothetical protein
MNEAGQTQAPEKAVGITAVTRRAPYVSPEERERGWEEWLAQLAAFKEQHGHLRVTKLSPGFHGLASWRDRQRALFQAGTLRPERQARLDALGFEWESPGMPDIRLTSFNQVLWEQSFTQLQAYRAAHGHCQVPYEWAVNPSLGEWVGAQRQLHRQGKMLAERQARLEQIGFKWTYENLWAAEQWERRFAELEAFQQKHGHLKVTKTNQTTRGLVHWRDDQRVQQRKGRLSPERKARLDALGFEWESPGVPRPPPASDLPKDSLSLWEYFFERLVAFKEQHGHLKVPYEGKEQRQMVAWMREQREGRIYGRLHFDQITRLEKLGFAWKAP